MSPAMSALASVGVTHNMLILAVLALVAAGVIGLYWHVIVPGAIVVLVGSLFINFTPIDKPAEEAKIEIKKEDVMDEHAAYIKDCVEIAEYPQKRCEQMWIGREGTSVEDAEPVNVSEKMTETHIDNTAVSKVKLIDVDNEEYKARRALALKKPNAVVFHETYR